MSNWYIDYIGKQPFEEEPLMTYRYKPRAFMMTDYGEVELPNHDTAIRNLDLTNPRLRMKWYERISEDERGR